MKKTLKLALLGLGLGLGLGANTAISAPPCDACIILDELCEQGMANYCRRAASCWRSCN